MRDYWEDYENMEGKDITEILRRNISLNLSEDDFIRSVLSDMVREDREGMQNLVAAMPDGYILDEPIKAQKIFYGEQWIVLQNRLLNAISDLELNERRFIMFLSPIVRKAVDDNPYQRTFVVRVKDFQDEYNIKSKRYYAELASIYNSLVNKSYIFWDFKKNRKTKVKNQVSWLTKAVYQDSEGEVQIDLHSDVVEMLTIFDKANPYTKYERDMIVNLGGYGIILFELIWSCLHQTNKTKTYTIEYLREKFNCVDSYEQIGDFKLYVIDRAIKDVEKHTPLRISYKQNKRGRVVSELVFSFKDISYEDKKLASDKPKMLTKRDLDTLDNNQENSNKINLLSQKQADYFASKLCQNSEFGGKFARVGEDMPPFIQRVSLELQRDVAQLPFYMPYLLKAGYTPNKPNS